MVAFPFITFVSSVAFSDKWTMKNRQGLHQTCMSCRIRSDVCGQPGAPTACTWEKAPCQHSFSSTRRFHITLCRVWKGEERKVYHDTSVLPDFLPKLRWILTLLPLNKLLVIALILKNFCFWDGNIRRMLDMEHKPNFFSGPSAVLYYPFLPGFPSHSPPEYVFCFRQAWLSGHLSCSLLSVRGKTSAYYLIFCLRKNISIFSLALEFLQTYRKIGLCSCSLSSVFSSPFWLGSALPSTGIAGFQSLSRCWLCCGLMLARDWKCCSGQNGPRLFPCGEHLPVGRQ